MSHARNTIDGDHFGDGRSGGFLEGFLRLALLVSFRLVRVDKASGLLNEPFGGEALAFKCDGVVVECGGRAFGVRGVSTRQRRGS